MEDKMFEKASRVKLRVPCVQGFLGVEQLWDLSLTKLNDIAKALNKKLKEVEEEDFLDTVDKAETETKLTFDIVLHILKVKKSEQDARKNAAEKKKKKEKLLALYEKKQDESLEQLSAEELLKQIEEL